MNGRRSDDVIQLGHQFQFAVSVRPDQYSLAVFPTRCNQLDSNLANVEAAVNVGLIQECLSLTTQW